MTTRLFGSRASAGERYEFDKLWFTIEDVGAQLAQLGYHDVPQSIMVDFFRDLVSLAEKEEQALLKKKVLLSGAARVAAPRSVDLSDPSLAPGGRVKPRSPHGPLHPTNPNILYNPPQTRFSDRVHHIRDNGYKRKMAKVPGTSQASACASTLPTDDYILDMFSQLEELSLLSDGGPAALAPAPAPASHGRPAAISVRASKGLAIEDSEYDDDSLNYDTEPDVPLAPPRRVHAHRPTSFIRPDLKPKRSKCDPVSRAKQYREMQKEFAVPGETRHNRVRRNVHQQIRDEREPTYRRPQRNLTRNTYVVPTSKKRSGLRWNVRQDMAVHDR